MSFRTAVSAVVLFSAVVSSIATSSSSPSDTFGWTSGGFHAAGVVPLADGVPATVEARAVAPMDAVSDMNRQDLGAWIDVDLGDASSVDVVVDGPFSSTPYTFTGSGLEVIDIARPFDTCDEIIGDDCYSHISVELIANGGSASADVEFWIDVAGPTPPAGSAYDVDVVGF